jgi:uncharacterized membrane protein
MILSLLQAQLDAITGDLGVFRQENLDLRRRLATAEAEKVTVTNISNNVQHFVLVAALLSAVLC